MKSKDLKKKEIRVFAPATVANVGCGFDIFGFALHEPGDEIILKVSESKGLQITKITGDEGRLPTEANKNTAGQSLLAMMNELKFESGLEMEVHKKMAIGSGLGSSAASAVASVFAFNAMLERPLSKTELLKYAIEGEKIASGESVHLDNIAACLYGGFILVRSRNPIDIVALPVPDNLFCTVIHPQIEIRTESSRKILRKQIPLEKAVTQWGNVAGTISALYQEDFELLKRSFDDVIVVPDRSQLIPYYQDLHQVAMDSDAIGCSISGSGPSIFALSSDSETARKIGSNMSAVLTDVKIGHDIYISKINTQGPKVIE
jgi:homoserine kinase